MFMCDTRVDKNNHLTANLVFILVYITIKRGRQKKKKVRSQMQSDITINELPV